MHLCLTGVFNYMLCHISAAERGFVTDYLGCFFSQSLAVVLRSPPRLCCVFLGLRKPTWMRQMLVKAEFGRSEVRKLSQPNVGGKVDPSLCPGSTLTAASAVFTTPSLTTGTPFVSSFCTPNTTHRRSRPPPLVPKMPLGPGQICSLCVLEDRTSVKCARVRYPRWRWGMSGVCCLGQHLFTHSWDCLRC